MGNYSFPEVPESFRQDRSTQITYSFTVNDIPTDAKSMRVWFPVPQSGKHQSISNIQILGDRPYSITKEKDFGNQIVYFHIKSPKEKTMEFTMTFDVVTREIRGWKELNKSRAAYLTSFKENVFLTSNHLIPIANPRFSNISKKIIKRNSSLAQKSRQIYNYVLEAMKYDKTGDGWGKGDAIYACDFGTGLCRLNRIPARFDIGMNYPAERGKGNIEGYHCWAWFFLPDAGWQIVDISEADKKPEHSKYYYAGHGSNNVKFTTGRDINLVPQQMSDALNFFFYPHIEIDDEIHDKWTKNFSYKDLSIN